MTFITEGVYPPAITPLVGELADPPKCCALLTKLPKSTASPVDENVTNSMVS